MITPLFGLIWLSILLYQKPSVHADFHCLFASFLCLVSASILGAKVQISLGGYY